jgi:hypothetical protein
MRIVLKLIWAASLVAFATLGNAQEKAKSDVPDIAISPVMLDSNNSTGATLGVEWLIKGKVVSNNLSGSSKETKDTFDDVAAADEERNPKNFLEVLLDAKWLYSAPAGAVSGGLFGKYEADQSLDNKQYVYGVRLTVARLGLAHKNRMDFIALDVNLGQVDPSKDEARQAALGTANLDRYYRWDVEFLYMYPIAARGLETLEYNYRYFRETNPPLPVEQAGLDRNKLSTFRLGFRNDLFVAYSTGKLPFDRQSDKIYEVGWSYKYK